MTWIAATTVIDAGIECRRADRFSARERMTLPLRSSITRTQTRQCAGDPEEGHGDDGVGVTGYVDAQKRRVGVCHRAGDRAHHQRCGRVESGDHTPTTTAVAPPRGEGAGDRAGTFVDEVREHADRPERDNEPTRPPSMVAAVRWISFWKRAAGTRRGGWVIGVFGLRHYAAYR